MTLSSARTLEDPPEAMSSPVPRLLILANPRSFRLASRNRLQRIEHMAQSRGIPLYAVDGPAEIAAALAESPPRAADRVVIIGGDGTLQAVVSQLATLADAGLAPSLCMLGGGRTNFTARDLGSHVRLLASLENLITEPSSWKTARRSVLRISGSGHGPLHGFFVAGALVDAVIRDCHEYRARSRGWLRTGHTATPWRLLQLSVLASSGRKTFAMPELELHAEGLGSISGRTRILLMTSLQHEIGVLNPYAERGRGRVRLTAISGQAEAFWRRLPALLTGRFSPRQSPAAGYLSGSTREVRVVGLPSICLDGQEYKLDPSRSLQVEAGPVFSFLHP